MLEKLRTLQSELQTLKADVSAVNVARIAKKPILHKAESIGAKWFSEFSEQLVSQLGVDPTLVESYSHHFGRLIKISAPNNMKKSYLETLRSILKSFRDDLIIPLQTRPKGASKSTLLSQILEGLSSSSENEYLNEAIQCARHDYYRAAAILGWCAAIDRIHRVIEKQGFTKFNVTTAEMASQTKGRFKKFNAVQSVASLSELREVFDKIILWVIEGMGLIDSNQHTRLRSCFDLRCQCAHPGDAPITEYNLLSFFSDINEIVLKNEKFKINKEK
jgi:hypothetical protein